MKNFIKIAVFLPVFLVLVACVPTPQRQALSIQDKSSIKSNRVLLNTTQREIVMHQNLWLDSDLSDMYEPMDSGPIVTHTETVAAGGGLLGDLMVEGIKHHDAGNAVKLMDPAQSALGDFDYVKCFRNQLTQKMTDLPWLKVKAQDLQYNISDSEDKIVNSAKENTVLFVGTTYALNSTFKRLEVATYVKLDQKQAAGNPPKVLYTNNFYFIYLIPNPTDKATNEKFWTSNNGVMLRSKLTDAASLLSSMIVDDIKNPNLDPYAQIPKTVTFHAIDGDRVKAKLVGNKNGYYILSLNTSGNMNGYMYAVNSNDLPS